MKSGSITIYSDYPNADLASVEISHSVGASFFVLTNKLGIGTSIAPEVVHFTVPHMHSASVIFVHPIGGGAVK